MNGLPAVLVERLDGSGRCLRLDAGSVAIGTAGECELLVEQDCGVEPCHVRIARDRRGLVLEVGEGCERVHVNARPVRERALLRVGDMISIGKCKWLVKQEGALPEWSRQEALRTTSGDAGLVALRAVSGSLSGRRLALASSLVVDANDLPGTRGGLEFECNGAEVGFRYRGESQFAPRVNGVQATSGVLEPGAQLAWGPHRLVLEAPGVAAGPGSASPGQVLSAGPEQEPEGEPPEEAAGPSNEVWWLIATAAVLALGIAVLLIWTA